MITSENSDSTLYQFNDSLKSPDIVHEYGTHYDNIPIIIDNGSSNCRVGWGTSENPLLVFKNTISKQRSKKGDSDLLIGNDISNIEIMRWQVKSPFDRNVITQFEYQEMIFDYTFSHLGISSVGCVDHPVVITEAPLNPNHCRQHMSELLFECYGVPSVLYGVDALFSLYNNHPNPASADALIVSCGYQCTHLMPVLGGVFQAHKGRRINLGGAQIDAFMQRILQLKYPGHLNAITLSRAEELVRNHTYFANDYVEDSMMWSDDDYYFKHLHKMQLPYKQAVSSGINLLTPEQQKEKRESQIKRLREVNAKRRLKKLENEEEKLAKLLKIKNFKIQGREDEYQKAMKKLDLESMEELGQTINRTNNVINNMNNKIHSRNDEDDAPSAKRLKQEKKCQNLLDQLCGEHRDKDMAAWLEDLRRQKQELLDQRSQRKQKRADMAKRRTQASQQRMRIITELAQGTKKKKEDTFGKNDDDWDVYKKINKDGGDSDSEAEQERLDELDTVLRAYDPTLKDAVNQNLSAHDLAEYFRLRIAVERIRAPEILFQPSIIGIDQSGVVDTLDFVLKKFTIEEQQRMMQNVFLTGGCASIPNFSERLTRDLQTVRPFQSTFNVTRAADPVLDSWYGARKMAMSPSFKQNFITKEMYMEMGGEYIKEHCASNIYYPTPAVSAVSAVTSNATGDEKTDT